ncbi:hypothetical protein GUJ93_ZPchr0007g6320 [Zizania palustris]|uniref:Bifunctional inhibitor/plant lipid transfer protein/seed storage helical domain-containing protein n=1 Tax=Zizania palustris TaxID=103762 RepID=A0A8J5T9X6_ZIZPA|nr:hypothetical protein GUJ93_ZPchr0007g6320 [Zizania palustris]
MAGGSKKATMSAVAMVALLLLAAATAAVGAAGLCGVDQSAVDACRSYCTAGSTEARPSQACCSAVARADFGCLCSYKGFLKSYSNIDPNRAMQIPANCGMKPVSCK